MTSSFCPNLSEVWHVRSPTACINPDDSFGTVRIALIFQIALIGLRIPAKSSGGANALRWRRPKVRARKSRKVAGGSLPC